MWNPFKRKSKDKNKSLVFAQLLRQALGSGQPGQWASDHRTESEQYTGWTYVAVRSICLQAMQASVSVFQDENDPRQKQLRRSMRDDPGRRRLKSLYASEEGEAEPLPNTHPLCKMLKRPNPTQSGAQFRYEQVLQLQLTGSCIIWNVPNKLGKTVQRYVIPTGMTTPVAPSTDLPTGGFRIQTNSSRYAVVDDDGFTTSGMFSQIMGRVVPLEQIQVVRWPHPLLKEDGQSPVSAGAKWIDSANQIDQARWSQMNNGADPSVILTLGPEFNMSPEEAEVAAEKICQKYGGPENAGKAMVTNADNAYTLTTTPKDMSYTESFNQLRDAALALHGVPGIAAGISDGGSYAAFYASLKQFVSLTVQPILDLIAEEETEQLSPQFGEGLTVEIEAAQIDDPEVLERRITTDVAARSITVDEVRALRGLPPLGPERGGDQFAGQVPMSPLTAYPTSGPDTTGQEGPPQPEKAKPEDRLNLKEGQPNNGIEAPTDAKSVQQTALNGAQVASLVQLATSLSTDQLPYETVRKLIEAAFPLMEQNLIDEILRPLLNFDPPPGPPVKSHRFLSNGKATAKAMEILKNWRDYPGGQP